MLISNSIANIRSFIHFGSKHKHYDNLTSQVTCTIAWNKYVSQTLFKCEHYRRIVMTNRSLGLWTADMVK
jgi:hypothetical protein